MKQKNKLREKKIRKEKIIEFVKNHPFCSKDSIFREGKIPRSQLTEELIDNLVKEKKIACTGRKKIVYYIPKLEFTDVLEYLEYLTKRIEYIIEEEKSPENKIFPRLLAYFLKIRLKVIKAEKKRIDKYHETTFEKVSWLLPKIKNPFEIIPLNDVLERLKETVLYHENPSKLHEMWLSINLVTRIQDDEFYLKHQLHAHPQEKLRPFHKSKISGKIHPTSDLITTVKKGRSEFGLSLREYKKNIEKLGVFPGGWLQRILPEYGSTLYSNIDNVNITHVSDAVARKDRSVYENIVKPMGKVMEKVGLQREHYTIFMQKPPKKINRKIVKEIKILFKKYEIEFYSDRNELLADLR